MYANNRDGDICVQVKAVYNSWGEIKLIKEKNQTDKNKEEMKA